MFAFIRGARNLMRLAQIAFTLAEHDALFPLDLVGAAAPALRMLRLLRRPSPAMRGLRPGQRLAAALQRLGPSFIKLGQVLSTRADLLGEQVAADLSSLQDRLPPFPGKEACRIIEEELGRPVSDLFLDFDDEAIAAASIAQVHFATTIEDEPVAVKVLRP